MIPALRPAAAARISILSIKDLSNYGNAGALTFDAANGEPLHSLEVVRYFMRSPKHLQNPVRTWIKLVRHTRITPSSEI
jgi:hypothetical protein